MRSKEEIFKNAYLKASGKEADDITMYHMKYVMDAMEEYAEERITKALKLWNDFMDKLEQKVEGEGGTDNVGEFVMDHFDLWL